MLTLLIISSFGALAIPIGRLLQSRMDVYCGGRLASRFQDRPSQIVRGKSRGR